MVMDLYSIPPSLKSCDPVDSSDLRYLNQSYSPITNPLSKPLNIDFTMKHGLINHYEHLN